MFEILTLAQTRKLSKKLLVILYGSEYWDEVLRPRAAGGVGRHQRERPEPALPGGFGRRGVRASCSAPDDASHGARRRRRRRRRRASPRREDKEGHVLADERKKLIERYRDGYARGRRSAAEDHARGTRRAAGPGALVGARDHPSPRRQRDDRGRRGCDCCSRRIDRRFRATTRTSSRAACTTTVRTRCRSSCSGSYAQSTAEILDRLTPAEWVREGTHTEAGPYGVEAWLKTYAEHAHKHARQIRVARDATVKNG